MAEEHERWHVGDAAVYEPRYAPSAQVVKAYPCRITWVGARSIGIEYHNGYYVVRSSTTPAFLRRPTAPPAPITPASPSE